MNNTFEINSNFNETFTEDCNIFLHVNNCNEIKYSIIDSNCNVFVLIDVMNNIDIVENIDIINSNANFYYIDLNDTDFSFKSNINIYRNSVVNVNTILIGSNNKKIIFNTTNVEDHSEFEIHNNVIGLEKSDFSLEVIGNILKKSPYSKCIQKTHCLSVGEPINMRVLPVLNIDNENVVASHSLSSGTIDSNILYYLNSRGFTKAEALKLIVSSFLSLPENIIDTFKYANIDNLFNRKVESLCLM